MGKQERDTRELTKAEKKRDDQYRRLYRQLVQEGYEANDLTIGLVYANVMAFVLGLPIVILLFWGFGINHPTAFGEFEEINILQFFVIFFFLFFVHELIHGITWSVFAKEHWRAISFGFVAKYMTPYCCYNQPLRKGEYLAGAIMTVVVLGIVPSVIAIFTGSVTTLLMGALMVLCGGGDLTIVLKLLRFHSAKKEVRSLDHPYQAGLVVFTR